MLTVLDYGGGNLKSVVNMLDSFGLPYGVTDKAEDVINADRLIFPGQGHFGQVMEALKFKGLAEPLRRAISSGVPFWAYASACRSYLILPKKRRA